MRYEEGHKERTRQRVLKQAVGALRREGPVRLSVARVMADAGLTHGGFYAHFGSRADLIAEAVGLMFCEGLERLDAAMQGRAPPDALRDYVEFYLSAAHRDARSAGCPVPFLSGEAPKLAPAARERFAEGVKALEERIAALLAAMGRPEPGAEAGSLLAELAGALALSRAEPDRGRADAILARSRRQILRRFGLAGQASTTAA